MTEIAPVLYSLDEMKYDPSYLFNSPESLQKRKSDRWRDSLRFHLKPYVDAHEPIALFSAGFPHRAPIEETILVTDLSAAKVTIKKLIGREARTGFIKEVQIGYHTIHGFQAPDARYRGPAIINMKRFLNLEPVGDLDLPGPSSIKAAIGMQFELWVGLSLEKRAFRVKYNGIQNSFKDDGIDLDALDTIADERWLLQAKNWAKPLTDMDVIQIQRNFEAYKAKYEIPEAHCGIVISNTASIPPELAQQVKERGMEIFHTVMPTEFEQIKCISSNERKSYFLPKSKCYYHVSLCDYELGFLVQTEEEARELGFSRSVLDLKG